MKMSYYLLVLTLILNKTNAQSKSPSPEIQIKLALLAAPEEKRAGAMVYGYDNNGNLTVLRNGTNEMICLGDNPREKGFSIACYHKDMEA